VAQVDITVYEVSQSNETQAEGLTESTEDTTNETSTERDTGTSSLEQPNQPPNANAGNDQNVEVNTQVNLDGSKSSDQDGEIVSYKWEQTGGAEIDLKQSDAQTASFDVPESAADSTLTFKLTVVDDKDASDPDEVTVEIGSAVNNEAQQTDTNTNQQTDTNTNTDEQTETKQVEQNISPKADAGGDKNAEVNTEVKLNGGDSSDEDGEIVSYKWERTDGPKVDLKNGDEKTASFDVPESAADSKLSFKLKVVDDKDASDSDNTTVEVKSVPQESDEESDPQDNSDAKGNSDTKGKSN
jgi:chitinase